MANILIRELDNTAYLNRQIINDNIVVVAGSHSSGTANAGEFILCRSLREFYNNFGQSPLTEVDEEGGTITSADNIGWEYAANIIRAGFPVLYYSYYKGTEVSEAVTARTASTTKLYTQAHAELLSDKIMYNLKFLPSIYDEYSDDETVGIIQSIAGVDGSNSELGTITPRGDSLALIDFSSGVQDALSGSDINPNYTPELAADITGNSYTVVASPAAYLVSPITGSRVLMPPSFWVIKTMAEGVSKGLPVWATWAGAKRGQITGVDEFYSKVTAQTMRTWTESLGVIPLMNIPPYGDLIFGNSTRLHVGTIKDNPSGGISIEAPTAKSALDSLNVRLVANEIKRSIFSICLGLAFDSNDMVLWNEFKEKLIPVLDSMKANRGINDYVILMDETIVTNEDIDALTVPGVVKVDISRAAETFDITFELTPSGAVFDTQNL